VCCACVCVCVSRELVKRMCVIPRSDVPVVHIDAASCIVLDVHLVTPCSACSEVMDSSLTPLSPCLKALMACVPPAVLNHETSILVTYDTAVSIRKCFDKQLYSRSIKKTQLKVTHKCAILSKHTRVQHARRLSKSFADHVHHLHSA